MNSEEAKDEGHLLKPENDFEHQCNSVFDSIITQLKWRFQATEEVSENFKLLRGDQLAKAAENLARKYISDLDASEFIAEISLKYPDSMMNNLKEATPLEILQFIHPCALTDAYPNIEIAIRMYLAIPVTVASCEISSSKLKLIKNYLPCKTNACLICQLYQLNTVLQIHLIMTN